jgi:hypothetical protein
MLMVQMFFVTFAPSFFIGSSRLRYVNPCLGYGSTKLN